MEFKSLIKSLAVFFLMAVPAVSAQAQSKVIRIDNPKMTVFLPPSGIGNGKALVALPGGGYSHLAVYHEGFDWAPFYNQLGLAYAVLEYLSLIHI